MRVADLSERNGLYVQMKGRNMSKAFLPLSLLAVLLVIAACASKGTVDTGKTIKSGTIGNLTVKLSNSSGQLKHSGDEFFVTFQDSSGKPVDVGAASLTFHMPQMGSMMPMNDPATLTTTEIPGIYHGKTNIEMAGEWQAQIAFEGSAGKGQTSLSVSAH